MDARNSEGPEPGGLATLPAAGLALTTLAWQAGRVGLSFVVALEPLAWRAQSWPCSQRALLPGGPQLPAAGSWLGPRRQRPGRGQAEPETAMLEWEPRGLARKWSSRAGGHWPLEGGGV